MPSEPMLFVRDLDRGINDYTGWSFPGVVYTVEVVGKEETFGMIAGFNASRTEFDR
jgi:hypothetical protein